VDIWLDRLQELWFEQHLTQVEAIDRITLQNLDHRRREVTADVTEPTHDSRLRSPEPATPFTPATWPTAIALTTLIVVERAESYIDTGIITSKPMLTILAAGLFTGVAGLASPVVGLTSLVAALIAGLTTLVVRLIFGLGPEAWFRRGSGIAMTFIGDVVGYRTEQETPASAAFGFRHSLDPVDGSAHTTAA